MLCVVCVNKCVVCCVCVCVFLYLSIALCFQLAHSTHFATIKVLTVLMWSLDATAKEPPN